MTENEARNLVNRIANLCHEYERDCGCQIMIDIHEERTSALKVRFLKFDGSIKVDK